MKVQWDYTELAEAYVKRPDYADQAIHRMVEAAGLSPSARICDVGAGAAHLTILLAKQGFAINAVEPNDAMRTNGVRRTSEFPLVKWSEGVGEATGMESAAFELVTFGSSFNVCDRALALQEAHRILKPEGWFACMWNHRDLDDPLQQRIEEIIQSHIQDYAYGSRREDQTAVIDASGLFGPVVYLEGSVTHAVPVADFIEGWKSHGTLHRQSQEMFDAIIEEIGDAVRQHASGEKVSVPYTTRIWMAQKKA